jgi:hypothetical protein
VLLGCEGEQVNHSASTAFIAKPAWRSDARACPQFPNTNNTQLAAAVAVAKWETPWAFFQADEPALFPPLAFPAENDSVRY